MKILEKNVTAEMEINTHLKTTKISHITPTFRTHFKFKQIICFRTSKSYLSVLTTVHFPERETSHPMPDVRRLSGDYLAGLKSRFLPKAPFVTKISQKNTST